MIIEDKYKVEGNLDAATLLMTVIRVLGLADSANFATSNLIFAPVKLVYTI